MAVLHISGSRDFSYLKLASVIKPIFLLVFLIETQSKHALSNNNLVVFSLAGIFNEILVISSIIIAEIRFKKDKKVNNIEGDNNEQN